MVVRDKYNRAIYDSAQINAFFDRISLPPKHRAHAALQDTSLLREVAGLEVLTFLHVYTQAALPFESLSLHYAEHAAISVEPQALYDKIIRGGVERGRGGYCMENNAVFGTLLLSLGFDVYPASGRVNRAVEPTGGDSYKGVRREDKCSSTNVNVDRRTHMINIITIAGKKYFADVGFGGSGIASPCPLEDGYTAAGIGNNEIQLTHSFIPDLLTSIVSATTNVSQKLWALSFRFTESGSWTPAYAFGEAEALPDDFVVMNYYTSTSPSSWFTKRVVCVRFVMDESERLVGDVTLNERAVKKRIMGKTVEELEVTTEEERVQALDIWLGVRLSDEERNGIKGRPSELPPSGA